MRRPIATGSLVGGAVTVVVVGGGAAVLGLDVAHAVALGACALVVVLLLTDAPRVDDEPWTDDPVRPPGGLAIVEQTAWGLVDREGLVRYSVLERLRRLAGRDPESARAFAPLLRTDRRPPAAAELDLALRGMGQDGR